MSETNTPNPRNNMGAGILVLIAAMIIGIVVLNSLDNDSPKSAAKAETTTTVKESPDSTTSTTAELKAAKDVTVLVANASNATGVAANATTELKDRDYETLEAVTANVKLTKTYVYYRGGYQKEATVLAAALGLPPESVQPLPTLPSDIPLDTASQQTLVDAQILVVIGSDQVTKFQSTTGTTVAGTSATTTTSASN